MSDSAWWRADQVAAVEHALERAAGGNPALLTVEGAAGMGKSTLLGEVQDRARALGFETIRVEGRRERIEEPYSLLHDMGIDAATLVATTDPFQAAQALRELVDRNAAEHPVLLAVDDLQWADRESVESLTWLLRRAHGEQLLVVLASRPPSAQSAETWRRLQEGAGRDVDVTSVTLAGLTRELTGRLVRSAAPGAESSLVDRLWQHTHGNPLYLRTLLREYGPAELWELDGLPAPAEVTRAVTTRLEGLDPDAVLLIRAVAVLGDEWSALARATEVAGLDRSSESVRLLEEEELLRQLGRGTHTRVRIVHAVLRAAVYQDIPAELRARLHLLAAATATTRIEELGHRFAATDGYDAALADDLDAAARTRHDESAYRDSARLLVWAAEVTEDARRREGRGLDAVFELAVAKDTDEVAARLGDRREVVDQPRWAAAHALDLVVRGQWIRARDVLDDVAPDDLRASAVETRYRLLTLRAWAGAVTGRPSAAVLADLDEAEREGWSDDALAAYAVLARRQGESLSSSSDRAEVPIPRRFEPHEHLTRPQLYELGWAGGLHAVAGDHDYAIPCLLRFTESLRTGLRDPSDGGYRALLGYAQWMKGEWDAARMTINLALESRFGSVHPMVSAVAPLVHLSAWDLSGARSSAARSQAGLALAPWSPAVQIAFVSQVLLKHAEDDPVARQRLWSELTSGPGAEAVHGGALETSALTALHLGLAQVWAGRLDEAERLSQGFEQRALSLPWLEGGRAWLLGLVALARDDPAGAQVQLRVAVPGLVVLPLHSAHASADLVRASELVGDTTGAAAAREGARSTYTRLGLHDYARRLSPAPSAEAVDDPLAPLSDRERDVVTLLARGMSYEQIARELYVSRSTVAFHLGHAYAKTNTATRHELVDLIHTRIPT
jgi:DNA-binding CsgD family transcriptional regulator